MPAVYGVDLIAKRDRKIKMDRSIVKFWNVHYQTLEEVEEAERLKKQKQEEEARKNAERLANEEQESETQEHKKNRRMRPITLRQALIPGIMEKNRYMTKTKSSRSMPS